MTIGEGQPGMPGRRMKGTGAPARPRIVALGGGHFLALIHLLDCGQQIAQPAPADSGEHP